MFIDLQVLMKKFEIFESLEDLQKESFRFEETIQIEAKSASKNNGVALLKNSDQTQGFKIQNHYTETIKSPHVDPSTITEIFEITYLILRVIFGIILRELDYVRGLKNKLKN